MRLIIYFAINNNGNIMYVYEKNMEDTPKDYSRFIDCIDDYMFLEEELNFKDDEKPSVPGMYQATIEYVYMIEEYRFDVITCTPLVLVN